MNEHPITDDSSFGICGHKKYTTNISNQNNTAYMVGIKVPGQFNVNKIKIKVELQT